VIRILPLARSPVVLVAAVMATAMMTVGCGDVSDAGSVAADRKLTAAERRTATRFVRIYTPDSDGPGLRNDKPRGNAKAFYALEACVDEWRGVPQELPDVVRVYHALVQASGLGQNAAEARQRIARLRALPGLERVPELIGAIDSLDEQQRRARRIQTLATDPCNVVATWRESGWAMKPPPAPIAEILDLIRRSLPYRQRVRTAVRFARRAIKETPYLQASELAESLYVDDSFNTGGCSKVLDEIAQGLVFCG